MKLPLLKLVLIACGHVALGYCLYRLRVMGRGSLFHSDLFVFALPALLAYVGYTFVLHREIFGRTSANPTVAGGLSLGVLLTIISLSIMFYLSFDRFGT